MYQSVHTCKTYVLDINTDICYSIIKKYTVCEIVEGYIMKKNRNLIYTTHKNHVPIGRPFVKDGVYWLEVKNSDDQTMGYVELNTLIQKIKNATEKQSKI